jgi:hypothetical protein
MVGWRPLVNLAVTRAVAAATPFAPRGQAGAGDLKRVCRDLYGEEIISKFAPNFRQFSCKFSLNHDADSGE